MGFILGREISVTKTEQIKHLHVCMFMNYSVGSVTEVFVLSFSVGFCSQTVDQKEEPVVGAFSLHEEKAAELVNILGCSK